MCLCFLTLSITPSVCHLSMMWDDVIASRNYRPFGKEVNGDDYCMYCLSFPYCIEACDCLSLRTMNVIKDGLLEGFELGTYRDESSPEDSATD